MSLWTLPLGSDRLLLHMRRRQEAVEMDRKLARVLLEVGGELPNPSARAPGDARALRGIPMVGVRGGLGGAIGGTRPDTSLR